MPDVSYYTSFDVRWSPHLKRDIEHIEKVQRRFTKRLVGMKTPPYTERTQ